MSTNKDSNEFEKVSLEKIGLIDESRKYAALLGYNYQSSKWYEESYKILNKNYKKISKTKNKKKEESIIQKFKDLLK